MFEDIFFTMFIGLGFFFMGMRYGEVRLIRALEELEEETEEELLDRLP